MVPAPIVMRARRAVAVLAAGLALVLIAFVFSAAPLFVAGVALSAIGALTPLWILASAHGARARRTLTVDRVLEDAPLHATIEVHRPLAACGWGRLEVVDPLTDSRLRLGGVSSPVRRARDARIQVSVPSPRRGRHVLAPPAVIAGDPLDLARAQAPAQGPPQVVLVLPRTEPVRWSGVGRGPRLAGEDGGAASEALAASDFDGLRPYRPGTPASRIHWSALARGQGLIERRLRADGDEHPLIVLDGRTRGSGTTVGDPAGVEALDAAVRAAASLVLELGRRGGCGLLLAGEARPTAVGPELSAWPVLHGRLALAGTDADPHRGRAPSLARSGHGPLVYVTAVPHERLVTELIASRGRGSVVLVVPDAELAKGLPPGVRAGAAEMFAVSGCRGFALDAPRRNRPTGVSAGAGRP